MTLSCCQTDDDRRPGRICEEIREAVSDRGSGVRSTGEAAQKGRRHGKGTAIIQLTTTAQVTVDTTLS